jgi:hypothetical protein
VLLLLFEFGSLVAELIVAVFVMIVSVGVELLTVAIITAVADVPAANDGNETVRLFPLPPHVPVAALHETNVTCEGRLSVIVTAFAVLPVLLIAVNR